MITAAPVPIVTEHFARSAAATMQFFGDHSPLVAECCRRMADHFARGGTLKVMGEGAQTSDAQHMAVEFVHPIIVGKRALPAAWVTSDVGGSASDIVVGLCTADVPLPVAATMTAARERGALTILITGSAHPGDASVDFCFQVADANPLVIQEVSETLYHVLWELVHVFFEAEEAHLMAFLPRAAGGPRQADVLAGVQGSTVEKARDICALRATVQNQCGTHILAAGRAVADRIRSNGKLLAFGNGGSATDAQDVAADCLWPALPGWQRVPAMALTNDASVVTAIGNDVGFDHVFSRQIIAFGRAGDVAIGFSTSGASRNVMAALAEAKARGLLTIAMSGGDGGALSRSPVVDFCFTAPSEHLPRIQEAHATIWHALLSVVQEDRR
jgi:D-sedoheptulose 7-phosphate isomerase